MNREERKQTRKRMVEIRRTIEGVARISAFLSKTQLEPYEAMADEYRDLERKLAEAEVTHE